MLRILIMMLALVTTPVLAGEPPSNDPKGVDAKILPDELTVFVAQTADLGPWPSDVIPDVMEKYGIPNLGWLRDSETGLKICRRTYMYILDKAAGNVQPSDVASLADVAPVTSSDVVPLHPDATVLGVCAHLALMTPQPEPGTKWFLYKVACPQRVLIDSKTKFKDPDCPSDCRCVNEPEDL